MEENQNKEFLSDEPLNKYIFKGDVYLDDRNVHVEYRTMIQAHSLENAKTLLKYDFCRYTGLNPEANVSFLGKWSVKSED
ncbi:hypothetical protein [Turicimonas muris]|uniref:hypothetical protein n=1 Tax=Turicimonas muris TaxID=1796652 RepID=UPI002612B822|nr:hypothetical protein [Turicimonas muris]